MLSAHQVSRQRAMHQMTTAQAAPLPALRRTTYRVPPFADDVVRAHAAQLSRSRGGIRVTYTESLVELLAIAAAHLGIAVDHERSNATRE